MDYILFYCRGHCGNFSQTATTSIETTNDPFLQIPLVGLQIYEYNITLQSVTNGMFSETVDLTVFTPVTSDFNCVDCRVQRVRINQDTNVVTCEVSFSFSNRRICILDRKRDILVLDLLCNVPWMLDCST